MILYDDVYYGNIMIGRVDCRNETTNCIITNIYWLLRKSGKYKNLSTNTIYYISRYIYYHYIEKSKNDIDILEIYETTIEEAMNLIREDIILYLLEK